MRKEKSSLDFNKNELFSFIPMLVFLVQSIYKIINIIQDRVDIHKTSKNDLKNIFEKGLPNVCRNIS